MKNIKRYISISFLVLLILLIFGCSANTSSKKNKVKILFEFTPDNIIKYTSLFLIDSINNLSSTPYKSVVSQEFKNKLPEKLFLENMKYWQATLGEIFFYQIQSLDFSETEAKVIITTWHLQAECHFMLVWNNKSQLAYFSILDEKFQNNLASPPPYLFDSGFSEKNVKIGLNSKEKLDGKLFLPKTKGKVPVVIFIHDIGAYDMYHQIGVSKIFKTLQMVFNANGIGVLLYNKRSFQYEENKNKNLDQMIIDDAVSAFILCAQEKNIDSDKISLFGFSLGGYLLPKIVDKIKNTANNSPHKIIAANGLYPDPVFLVKHYIKFYLYFDNYISSTEQEVLTMINNTGSKDFYSTDFFWSYYFWEQIKGYDFLSGMNSLQIPSLIIQSDKSCFNEPEISKEIFDKLADNEFITKFYMENKNHFFSFLEGEITHVDYFRPQYPDQDFVEILLSFLMK